MDENGASIGGSKTQNALQDAEVADLQSSLEGIGERLTQIKAEVEEIIEAVGEIDQIKEFLKQLSEQDEKLNSNMEAFTANTE